MLGRWVDARDAAQPQWLPEHRREQPPEELGTVWKYSFVQRVKAGQSTFSPRVAVGPKEQYLDLFFIKMITEKHRHCTNGLCVETSLELWAIRL